MRRRLRVQVPPDWVRVPRRTTAVSIGDMVRRMVDDREPRNPDGGIGGLTAGEEHELDDLLNGPHKLCECGQPGCGCPIFKPGLRNA